MILASKSPRRKEILQSVIKNLEILVPNIEEVSCKEGITEQIIDIARKKCEKISFDNEEKYVLAADTVVVVDDKILGKPCDEKEAFEMISILSGREHFVITAYVFQNKKKNFEIANFDISKVKFKKIENEEINWYINTKEPMDKAGAYGVQGKGALFIEKIEGDFFNVMGFPISKFFTDLKEAGFKIEDLQEL